VIDPGEKENQAENPQFLTIHTELEGILDQWKKQSSSDAAPSTTPVPRKRKK
jgi:hypothetical protein